MPAISIMKKSKLWEETFIAEESATSIALILRAKRFFRYWKKTYNALYPLLDKKGKKYVDEILPQIQLVTQEELDNRRCIWCKKKKCHHGKNWLEPISLLHS
jgi:hypothetical protein